MKLNPIPAQLLCATLLIFHINTVHAVTMTEINQLLASLKETQSYQAESALEEQELSTTPSFVQLESHCQSDWSFILDNFAAIEGGPKAKTLVIWALQGLNAGDYMTAIEKLVTMFENGQIDNDLIGEALHPTGRMQAFLADNHQHPRVVAALNRIKSKASGNAAVVTEVNELLSGETKETLDKFRAGHQGLAIGNIPNVPLQ